MEEIRKPHWPTWLHVQNVSLWEGVLLSLDIEPHDHDYDDSDLDYAARNGSTSERAVWDDVRRRLLVARRNVGEGGRLLESLYPSSPNSRVPLRKFAAWAMTVEWEMPSQLSQLAEHEEKPISTGRWPWGDYETDLLNVMAEAVKQLWSTFDPDQPTTAPTKDDVTAFLNKRLNEIGYSNPDTIASAMATIIRHPKAPVGRRPSTKK